MESKLLELLRTKTCADIFLLPLTGISEETIKMAGFIHAYSKDKQREHYQKDLVYVAFQPQQNVLYLENEIGRLIKAGTLIDEYDYEEGIVVLAVQLPTGHHDEYELLRNGQYSKLSETFKKLYPKYIEKDITGVSTRSYSLTYHIFNKTEGMRDFLYEETGVDVPKTDEYWIIPKEENETLDLDKLLIKK